MQTSDASAARPVVTKHPTNQEEILYQRQPGFGTQISIGGPAPDGAALTLDGEATTLHASLDADRPTILNFGPCT